MRADDFISRTRAIERLKLNFPISQGADNSRDRHRYMQALADIQAIRELPSVTPRLSSELDKNSKKLEKDFGELDCISRADAIKAMQNKAKKLKNEDTINGLCGAVAILYEMPSVTLQEPKTGHWMPTYGNVECSACGSVKDSREVGKATHYCDFCGAKMIEPQKVRDKE